MKKVRTYIEIKEYEDGTNDIQVSGSLIHVLTNMIAVLADLQKKNWFQQRNHPCRLDERFRIG